MKPANSCFINLILFILYFSYSLLDSLLYKCIAIDNSTSTE